MVARVEVAVGDRVTANSPLLSLYQPRALEVRARIPARFAQALEKSLEGGQPVQATSEDQRYRLALTGFAGESDPRGHWVFSASGKTSLASDQATWCPWWCFVRR